MTKFFDMLRLPVTAKVKSLLGDSGWQFAETGVRMLLSLVAGALVARHLSSHGFGVTNYVAAILALVVPLVRMGLDTIVLRDIAIRPKDTGIILSAALRLSISAGMLGMGGILAFAYFGQHEKELGIALAIGSLAGLTAPFGVFYGVLRANFYTGLVARYRIALAILFAAIRIAVVFGDGGVLVFVGISVLEELAIHLLCYVLCLRLGLLVNSNEGKENWKPLVKPLLKEGFPIMISFLLFSIYGRLDVVMLEHMRGIREVGIYGAAVRISELWHMIPGIVMGTFFPYFTKLRIEDASRFLLTMRRFVCMFFWGGWLVVLGMVALAPFITMLLFGRDFSDSIPALRAHILCFPAVCMGGLLSNWYIMKKMPRYLLLSSITGVGLNIGLNLIWIPASGATGAAFATAVSYAFASVISIFFGEGSREIRSSVAKGIAFKGLR